MTPDDTRAAMNYRKKEQYHGFQHLAPMTGKHGNGKVEIIVF